MLPAISFTTAKFVVQVISAILSLIINPLLIYLIITKSSKSMGNYRHLMIFFCCCSIFFSIMDIIVRPVIHAHKSAFMMIMDVRNREIEVHVAKVMVCGMVGCFGVLINGIAIHFVFRMFALERSGRVKYFDTKFLPCWFFVSVFGGISWCLVSYFPLSMNEQFSEYLRESLLTTLDMDVEQIAYTGAFFWPTDDSGAHHFNFHSGLGLLCYLLFSLIPLGTILYCMLKSMDKIDEFPVSEYGKDVQIQLYKALIAQTLIPVVLLFIPFTCLFILPLFELEITSFSNSLTFIYALYPVVDSLPIFFFVENYRRAVIKLFICNFPGKQPVASRVTHSVGN